MTPQVEANKFVITVQGFPFPLRKLDGLDFPKCQKCRVNRYRSFPVIGKAHRIQRSSYIGAVAWAKAGEQAIFLRKPHDGLRSSWQGQWNIQLVLVSLPPNLLMMPPPSLMTATHHQQQVACVLCRLRYNAGR